MKNVIKRCGTSFLVSCMCGMLANMLVEILIRRVMGDSSYSPVSPEFRQLFSSDSIAAYVNVLLYGVIGIGFSAMTFIYEIGKIGYIIQNIIYYIVTGIIWVPIVLLIWQLHRYPEALICTILGFVVTYVIMTILGYRMKKREIESINLVLEKRNEYDDEKGVEK